MGKSDARNSPPRAATVAMPSAEIRGRAALRAVAASLDAAEAMGKSVFVAVVSRNLQLLAFAGHETTPHICRQIAQDKAFTAVATGGSTANWRAFVASCPREEQDLMNRQPRFIAAAGGLAITHDGVVIGGIAVSGAGQDEDEACARAGLEAIGMASER